MPAQCSGVRFTPPDRYSPVFTQHCHNAKAVAHTAVTPAQAGVHTFVTPAQAGVQGYRSLPPPLDAGLRQHDQHFLPSNAPACAHSPLRDRHSPVSTQYRHNAEAVAHTAVTPAQAGVHTLVTPAQAGVQRQGSLPSPLDAGLLRHDRHFRRCTSTCLCLSRRALPAKACVQRKGLCHPRPVSCSAPATGHDISMADIPSLDRNPAIADADAVV
jgi:hypothetical protein